MTPLVLVHGFMGGSQQWQPQHEALSAFNPIALDLPGYGLNADRQAFDTIGGYADWALDHLTEMGIERFHLLGHSMGGMIVQEMIARAPERVSRLVLYGTGATGVLPGRFETIETSKARAQADGAKATARRIAATWFRDCEAAARFEDCATIAQMTHLPAIFAGLDAMKTWNGTAHLERIQSKTLVIWGDGDRTYPWHQTQELWQTIPDARLAVIPGCAHAPHLEKPALFNPILTEFLAQ